MPVDELCLVPEEVPNYEAIKSLHSQLDDDRSGDIDVSESVEVSFALYNLYCHAYNMHAHLHIHICTHINAHTNTHTRTRVYIHTLAHMYICTHISTHTNTRTNRHTTHARARVRCQMTLYFLFSVFV